jgi:hypothetical protein
LLVGVVEVVIILVVVVVEALVAVGLADLEQAQQH